MLLREQSDAHSDLSSDAARRLGACGGVS
uniref:Uncharacterized protein n=1 Tax=Zea mays TaxID=4577 RepID=C4J7Z1_MAIZE|nr:unknown [Zea mays]